MSVQVCDKTLSIVSFSVVALLYVLVMMDIVMMKSVQ